MFSAALMAGSMSSLGSQEKAANKANSSKKVWFLRCIVAREFVHYKLIFRQQAVQ
jgi:hypothetical protein